MRNFVFGYSDERSGEGEESCRSYQIPDRGLQLECVMVLHDGLLVPVLLYGSKTMIWRSLGLGLCRCTTS